MKYKTIQLPQGSVAVDETAEIKEGDYFLAGFKITAFKAGSIEYTEDKPQSIEDFNHSMLFKPSGCAKIVASTFFIDKVVPMWKVYDEVEELADNANGYLFNNPKPLNPSGSKALAFDEGFKVGYKAAKSSGSFSEVDLFKAFKFYAFASNSQQPYNHEELQEEFDKFVKTLKQETVEFVTDVRQLMKPADTYFESVEYIKTTTDDSGQKWCHLKQP